MEFLLARIAEDEALARESRSLLLIADTRSVSLAIKQAHGGETVEEATMLHYDRWSPRRVLAECAAKRALVELYRVWDGDANDYGQMESVLMILARVWSDHPDFDPAWAES